MKGKVAFTDAARRALAYLSKGNRKSVLEGVQIHLVENDPRQITRNKFLLKQPSVHTERELRIGHWRVFYSVTDDTVLIDLIGEKRNNRLLIEGDEFEL